MVGCVILHVLVVKRLRVISMSVMVTELYDALIDAGASEEKARTASKALADYESRFNNIDKELTIINGELKIMKWMLGLILVVTVIPFLKGLLS